MLAGIDAGSVSVKIALVAADGDVRATVYRRHAGRVLDCARELLSALVADHPHTDLRIACTGSTGKLLAERLGAPHLSELTALAAGAQAHLPGVRTLFEMGGEDAKLVLLAGDDDPAKAGTIEDFALNSVCAAGTGSFLDQQAERMGLSIEEFAALAQSSRRPARIAGRCSVFAKSDMIHLQQIATPLADIAAGLCFAVARNFRGSILRGRPVREPVAFLGGVALNAGVVRAFREVFNLPDLQVPELCAHLGALGVAARAARDTIAVPLDGAALERLSQAILSEGADRASRPSRPPLMTAGDGFAERHMATGEAPTEASPSAEPFAAYMGVDIGSISTNLAVLDADGRVLAKRYLRTASKPIEAVRTGLAEIGAELAAEHPGARIAGVGTTGSGRYMIADFIGADIVKNEITAQARAAVFIDPRVDTIFEIGGQDSKYISLRGGVIRDFEMNKACAAGTGSFLEEQAEKLSIAIKGEFAARALNADAPCRLGERCTVFMENSLMSGLERGESQDDLLAGLAYSIVENYLGRVVGDKPVGEHIFFQGGTAFNRAVTAAFEKHLGREITVPPHHDVTGAIGMALIAQEHAQATGGQTTFRGFDLAHLPYTMDSFTCRSCENACEINTVKVEGADKPLFYGGRCEKYDISRKRPPEMPDLFAARHAALHQAHEAYQARHASGELAAPRGRMGLPMVFFMHDYLPYFATLLWELGFEVVLSGRTTRKVVTLGTEAVLADTCFPIKAAQGHVRSLLAEGVDLLFIPSCINLSTPQDPFPSSLACPLTQSFPYQVRAAQPAAQVLAPSIELVFGTGPLERELHDALRVHGVSRSALRRAMRKASEAQARFGENLRETGRQVLERLPDSHRALVVIGRGYNALDPGMNLDVPGKLASLGELAIPMDMLPLPEVHDTWPGMYWRSGQRMLAAARAVRQDPRLQAMVLGNFSCGPDSFILKFFERELAGKPALTLEIDEHTADAGVITRCEAFLDSLGGADSPGRPEAIGAAYIHARGHTDARHMLIPPMSDHAYGLAAAFRACGVDADVMPDTDHEAIALAQAYVSGKECYPCHVTTADMLKAAQSPDFDRQRHAFFMPSGNGPCRFGQYNLFQRMVLDRAGFPDVPLYSPMQDESFYAQLGIVGSTFSRLAWEALVAIDLLTKSLHHTRPASPDPEAVEALYRQSLARICQTVAQGQPGALNSLLPEIKAAFSAYAPNGNTAPRPRIGIVGEIFVRSNRFSNENLVRKIETLGGAAWLAPIDEWVFYVGAMGRRRALKRRAWKNLLGLAIKHHVQTKTAHSFENHFHDLLPTAHEPSTSQVLAKAAPYLRDTFEGEAVLSIGKAVDMCERGAHGIVNAMPFGCMPGTVASALLRSVGQHYGVPVINIPYDGTESPTTRLTLETFMEQTRARAGA